MQTMWPGLAYPNFASNVVLTEACLHRTFPLVLHDTPGVPTVVHLPDTTMGVHFWTTDAEIWFAVNEAPGPIPPYVQTTLVQAGDFVVGGVILPNQVAGIALPESTLTYTIQLVSRDSAPRVTITALVQIP